MEGERSWFASCCTVLTGCHSLSLKPPDVHSFCSLYRLSMIDDLLHFLPLPYTAWLSRFGCDFEADNEKWTAIRAEFSVSSSSDVLAAGPERLIEELHFLLLDLACSRDAADEREGGEISHPFSLCPPRKCFPESRLGTSSIVDLPRAMGTMIVDLGRRSFPDKLRANITSPRYLPAHHRHPERIWAHCDHRKKQLSCSHIQRPPHPLGRRHVGEVEPPIA